MKKLGIAAIFLAVCLIFAACEAQAPGEKGTTQNDQSVAKSGEKAKVLQSYMMQDADSGAQKDGKVYLTLFTDGTFTYKIQMYDGYPTVDGTYEATDKGYKLKAVTTTIQNLPVNKLGDIYMEKDGDNLVYQGSQLNEILSGSVFVPCILSEDG